MFSWRRKGLSFRCCKYILLEYIYKDAKRRRRYAPQGGGGGGGVEGLVISVGNVPEPERPSGFAFKGCWLWSEDKRGGGGSPSNPRVSLTHALWNWKYRCVCTHSARGHKKWMAAGRSTRTSHSLFYTAPIAYTLYIPSRQIIHLVCPPLTNHAVAKKKKIVLYANAAYSVPKNHIHCDSSCVDPAAHARRVC